MEPLGLSATLSDDPTWVAEFVDDHASQSSIFETKVFDLMQLCDQSQRLEAGTA
jgi:hypothetical protein